MYIKLTILFVAFLAATTVVQKASAQMGQQQQWGSGQWGASQGCSYQQKMAPGAVSGDDETKDLTNQIAEAKKQLKAKKNEKTRLDRELERTKEDINGVITEEYSSFIFEHIENNRQCVDYKGYSANASTQTSGSEGGKTISPEAEMIPIQSFSSAQWGKYCDPSKTGNVSSGVCDAAPFRQSERNGASISECKKGLSAYRKNYGQSQKLQTEMERLNRSIERLNDNLKQAKADAKEAMKENGGRLAQTEGDICIECAKSGNGYNPERSQTNWGNVAANVGVGLAAMYMGYKSNQMVTDANASIGMPTYGTSPAWSYGLPYLQQGIYGAISSGSSQGGFGCGNSTANNAGGAFGYPQGMTNMNTMGGGMFMNGMNMNGMNSMMNTGYGNMSGSMMSGSMMMSNPYSMMTSSPYSSMGMGTMMSGNLMMSNPYSMMSSNPYAAMGLGYGTGYGSYGTGYGLGYGSSLTNSAYSSSTMLSLQQEMAALTYRMQMIQSGNGSYLGTSGYAGGTSSLYGTSGNYYSGPGTLINSSLLGTSR